MGDCQARFREKGGVKLPSTYSTVIDMIVLIIVAVAILVMGILILIGKGDNLIAGYNTASPKERSQYNIKRLRGLIGGLLIVLAPMMLLAHKEESLAAIFSFIAITFFLCIVVVILANTWAKKNPMK